MDSALRPREIQSRIRAGQSLEEVARLSGESAERIERFATPVLAEREHVARLALTSSVRRRGELGGHRPLRDVISEQLLAHGVDPNTVAWDAWRNEDRRWTVQAVWTQDDAERIARFQFDLGSRFSVADETESRWLIAEDDDSLDEDELAIVHAIGGDPTQAGAVARTRQIDPDEEPTISLADVPLRFAREPDKSAPEPRRSRTSRRPPRPPADLDSVEEDDWFPRSAATPQEIREELEAEIDAYGVVPEGRSELDVLYDMLSGIAEDSINIYAGLNDPVLSEPVGSLEFEPSEPVTERPVPQVLDLESQPTELRVPSEPPPHSPPAAPEPRAVAPDSVSRVAESARAIDAEEPATAPSSAAPEVEPFAPTPADATSSPDRAALGSTDPARPDFPSLGPRADDAATSTFVDSTGADSTGADSTTDASTRADFATDASRDQPPSVDNEPTIQVAPGAAKRRGARKKRAAVPSWDEIMFGGPKRD